MERNDDISKISLETDFDIDDDAYRKWLETHPLPVPSKEQVAWLEAEVGMFVHFGINTYHDMEWSDGTLDPATFNPVELDCNQWVQVAREMGARYMVLTAKHHDGFCLWQTETTDYSVASSPWKGGKGDVVKEFTDACKKAGMPCGLYLSPWDRHEPCYHDKEAYDKFYARQLEELLTWYDTEYFELWFDGAGSAGREYDWKTIIGVCKKYQPQALIFNMGEPTIRWAGNENGLAPYPLWNVVPLEKYGGLKEGKPDYVFLPAEADVPIRYHTWFYNSKNEFAVSPVEELMKMYTWSVGRGANLLLNIAPDRRGLIPEADREPAREFGMVVRELFSSPVKSLPGSPGAPPARGNVHVLDLGGPARVNYVVTKEEIAQGQRVRLYVLEHEPAGAPGTWEVLARGSSIGRMKIDLFPPVDARRLRLRILDSYAEPLIKEFSCYHSERYEEFRQYMEDDII